MILDAAALVWSAFFVGAAATAVVKAHRRISAAPVRASDHMLDELVLLRPCAGAEPGLAQRLVQTGGARRVIVAVDSLSDAAVPAARQAVTELQSRAVDASLVVTGARGPNHKAEQLACAVASRMHGAELFAVADSDVELRPDDFVRMVGELERHELAAVWAPTIEDDGRGLSAAVLNESMHSFAVLSGIDRAGFVGKLFVVRARPLETVGGFDALVDRLGEDMELARRLHAQGHGTAPSSVVGRARPRADGCRALVARLSRWVLVIRAQRPALLPSYPLLLAAGPLAIVVAVAGIAVRDPFLVAAGGVVLAMRVFLSIAVPRMAGQAVRVFRAPVRAVSADVLLLCAFVLALATRRVVWRGRELTIGEEGRLRLQRASEEANEPREHALCELRQSAGPRVFEDGEPVDARPCDRAVDLRQRSRDAVPLPCALDLELARRPLGTTDGDPEVGPLAPTEDVADADRGDQRFSRDPCDERGARLQLERLEGRSLAPLRIDPHDASGHGQEPSCMTDGAGAVPTIREVDAECADLAEERETPEVRRVHHGVRVDLQDDVREPYGDQGIPPRGVVRDDEHGALRARRAEIGEPRDEHPAERARDPGVRVSREEAREPGALACRDQGGAS